jgi:hypothetical protein
MTTKGSSPSVSSSHSMRAHKLSGNLQAVLGLFQVADRQAPAHALDQAPEQREEVALRLAENLELIPGRDAVLDLEGLQGDHRAQESGPAHRVLP